MSISSNKWEGYIPNEIFAPGLILLFNWGVSLAFLTQSLIFYYLWIKAISLSNVWMTQISWLSLFPFISACKPAHSFLSPFLSHKTPRTANGSQYTLVLKWSPATPTTSRRASIQEWSAFKLLQVTMFHVLPWYNRVYNAVQHSGKTLFQPLASVFLPFTTSSFSTLLQGTSFWIVTNQNNILVVQNHKKIYIFLAWNHPTQMSVVGWISWIAFFTHGNSASSRLLPKSGFPMLQSWSSCLCIHWPELSLMASPNNKGAWETKPSCMPRRVKNAFGEQTAFFPSNGLPGTIFLTVGSYGVSRTTGKCSLPTLAFSVLTMKRKEAESCSGKQKLWDTNTVR